MAHERQAKAAGAAADAALVPLEAKLALLRSFDVSIYETEADGREKIAFFPPRPETPYRSPKDLDDEDAAREQRQLQWERSMAMGAAGGIRATDPFDARTRARAGEERTLDSRIRRERQRQQRRGASAEDE